MSAIYILIGVSVIVAAGFLFSFIWSVRSGQYDDDYTPSVRMLFDDQKAVSQDKNQSKLKKQKNTQHGSRKNFLR
jgi:cbb3-type cytochrome oxidase maturation protein